MTDPLEQTVDLSTLERTAATGPGHTVALGATIAAPAPEVTGGAQTTLRRTNTSVLPRVEQREHGAQLVPSDGRRYEPLKTLGRGGMGEVALVEDRDIGRRVALKRLLDQGQSAPAVARFVDEVRTVGRLEHPNIVPIHDVGVDENGQLFFVMKFVDGETLEDVITRLRAGDPATRAAYGVQRCAEIFVALLRALQFAHERGVIHRDIKPANVMIGHFGEVVLMDWGVARPIGGAREGNAADPKTLVTSDGRASMTRVGALIGTPMYMSPEQARGQNDALDARSDLYSAAVVFHEMLDAGHHRFEGATSLPELLVRVQTTEAPGSTRIFQHAIVPAEYAHFLHRALQREAGKRWESASQMLDEMHLILDGRFHVQCPVTFTKRATLAMSRFVDRGRLGAVIVVGLGLLGVAALALNALRDVLHVAM